MPPSAVVIGASDLLDALKACVGVNDALAFPDSQPLQALQAISEHRPTVIVLERLFAATSRGAALINRIKSDPTLAQSEIRVLSHTGDYARVIARAASPPAEPEPIAPAAPSAGASGKRGSVAALDVETVAAESASAAPSAPAAESARPLDWRGTRREPRFRVRSGVEVQVDGTPATLIDLSVIGAQVLSTATLRPNQRVRVSLLQDEGPIRFRASVAWAKFELPRSGGAPQYRAGLEFLDADQPAVGAYCERVKL